MLTLVLSNGLALTQAAPPQETQIIQASGQIIFPSLKISLYTTSWNLAEYDTSLLAAAFGASQSWYVLPTSIDFQYSSKIDQIHAINPHYKALIYRDIVCIYDYWTDDWNTANSNGWLLKDSQGNYVISKDNPENYRVDITNPAYQTWVANKIKTWLDQYPSFDGVMVDNGLASSVAAWQSGSSASPINPKTGTNFTWDEIKTGYIQILNEIINAVGPSKLVVPNGIWNGESFYNSADPYIQILSQVPNLNGLMSEGTFITYNGQWYSESNWRKSLDMVSWVQNNFLQQGKVFIATCQAAILPSDATADQLIQYGYCSLMLAAKYSSPQNIISFSLNPQRYSTSGDLLQNLLNADIGVPLGNYYQIDSISLYTRDFSKAKVIVNPTADALTLTLDDAYTTLSGQKVAGSLTVAAHSGLLLLK
jgi:hypothetical protein